MGETFSNDKITLNVLKFQTLVPCQEGLAMNSADPDQCVSEIEV